MKNYFSLFLFLNIITFLSSCSYTLRTCQSFKTESTNVKLTNDHKYRYVDSLVRIDYTLWSSGGTVRFDIYNKSDAPIYINWKNSNFIFNSYNNEYWNDDITSEKTSTTYSTSTKNTWGTSATNINGVNPLIVTNSKYKSITDFAGITNEVTVVKKDNPSIQIPPKSFNTIQKFDLNFPLVRFSDSSNYVSYSKANSPLIFRNYLAISKDKDFEKQIFIDNDFWISSIATNISINPKSPCEISELPSDFYLINKKTIEDKDGNKKTIKRIALYGCFVPVCIAGIILITFSVVSNLSH